MLSIAASWCARHWVSLETRALVDSFSFALAAKSLGIEFLLRFDPQEYQE